MTEAQKAYRRFLQTPFWKELSERVKAAAGKCARCDSVESPQSHHRVYREDWFETQPEDLEVLCRTCHKKEHGIRTWLWTSDERLEGFYWAAHHVTLGSEDRGHPRRSASSTSPACRLWLCRASNWRLMTSGVGRFCNDARGLRLITAYRQKATRRRKAIPCRAVVAGQIAVGRVIDFP